MDKNFNHNAQCSLAGNSSVIKEGGISSPVGSGVHFDIWLLVRSSLLEMVGES